MEMQEKRRNGERGDRERESKTNIQRGSFALSHLGHARNSKQAVVKIGEGGLRRLVNVAPGVLVQLVLDLRHVLVQLGTARTFVELVL